MIASSKKHRSDVINGLVLLLGGLLLLHPRTLTGEWVHAKKDGIQQRRAITALWDAAAQGTSRLDEGGGDVVLVEFSDYECPACRLAHGRLDSLLALNRAGVVYRHLPLTRIHDNAETAALAAICADDQGRFLPMHRQLMTTDDWRVGTSMVEVAARVAEIDLSRFSICVDSQWARDRLAEDLRLAETLRIRSTPTFLHRRGIIIGASKAAAALDAAAR